MSETPASSRVEVAASGRIFVSSQTMDTASRAPARADHDWSPRPRTTTPTPIFATAATPNDAPAATPRMYGVASGFRKTAWKTAPPTANPAPPRNAAATLGTRICQKILETESAPNGSRATANGRGTGPMNGAPATTATAPTISSSRTDPRLTIRSSRG